MKKITLLVASALLLLTACGQVESNSAEVVPPPTNVAQEDVRQPQATPEPTMVAQGRTRYRSWSENSHEK